MFIFSHASIDPATRAARGLPEDLIRLCVGIEDATDLVDDLEAALREAGAIKYSTAENKFILARHGDDPISRAVQKLALDGEKPVPDNSEWFVSAPGKVILFGEHAVVHGVVRALHSAFNETKFGVDCSSGICRSAMLRSYQFASRWKNICILRRH